MQLTKGSLAHFAMLRWRFIFRGRVWYLPICRQTIHGGNAFVLNFHHTVGYSWSAFATFIVPRRLPFAVEECHWERQRTATPHTKLNTFCNTNNAETCKWFVKFITHTPRGCNSLWLSCIRMHSLEMYKETIEVCRLNTEMPTVKFQLRCCCRTKQLALSSFRSLRLVKLSYL